MNNHNQAPTLSPQPCISDYVSYHARHTPDREAVIFGDQRLTYAELETQVQCCAKALMAVGVEKGDRVSVLCTPRLEYWITFLAVTSIGAIWLGLNPKYKLPEIRYVLEDAQPILLLAMMGFEGHDNAEIIGAVQQDYSFIKQVIALTGYLPNTTTFDDFLTNAASVMDCDLVQRKAQMNTFDPALLVYTSGSTGKPKGALLSHYGLCFGAEVQNQHYQLKQPRLVCSFPINHVACVADTCCVNLVAGGTLVFQERFDAQMQLRAIREEKLNLLLGVPTMLLMLLEHPDFTRADLSSLKMIVWGGAALPVPIIKRLQQLVPRLMNVYGMTETAANTTYSSVDADITELSETIGHPSPYMPCRIVNGEGKVCEVGEEGELQFKGDYLLLEYINRPEATKAVYIDDGWLHSGDLGYWREDGTITLVGRLSDMFKSGGYNVYPREIENLLESHPSIEMAAVVAVPDDRFQEVGIAYVILSCQENGATTEEVLITYCKEHLANYKVPKTISIVKSLPTLAVGKVDKVALKQQAITVLNEKAKTCNNKQSVTSQ